MTDADKACTSKLGSIDTPSNPVAELLSGVLMSATSLAVSGRLAERPDRRVADPSNVVLMPTSYEMTTPSLKIPGTSIPASGIGAENSSLVNWRESGFPLAVIVVPSSKVAAIP